MFRNVSTIVLLFVTSTAVAGPYPSYLDNGISASSMNAWATVLCDDCYQPAPGVIGMDGFGGGPHNDPTRGLGAANEATVSLGDLDADQIAAGELPGRITVGFGGRVFDGPGADFAVFENAGDFFTAPFIFAELGYVEVSSNGVDFARFPSTSLNTEVDLDTQFGRNFAALDTTNVNNLAGVHPTLTGTPFDLANLATDPIVTSGAVDLDAIKWVRIVDIPGNGASADSQGNPILDTWLMVGTGGFDLDAVGAIHFVPEPGVWAWGAVGLLVFLGLKLRVRSG